MNTALRIAIDEAFFRARKALSEKAPTEAFPWLERVHILSQRMPVLHARSHWLMLRAGWQLRDFREVLSQVPRIMAALLFSKIWVPLGNTGRANVSAFAPMPISQELQRLLQGEE
ncbi:MULTISPECIES: DUF3703 domain-containing protein [unclassified Pseudomonas]|uniref:DUF3703 domain-containing protein n=1 Tax=unclassified Pseudomonas TaxID=196821 RepID=UPI000C86CD27|nr:MULTISPECIES: DUF3703 domain-containing protein [unclassified Pseudomonas]PMV97120.1 hypothetical protein C1X55_17500 [Pseudomonas sp. GW460-C8]PMW17154.1 hypothetical protein C1X40_17520 [Pseudomonas sp. GW456-11-11-14-TSB2]PMW21063.1 hypothetical protein C1X53_16640 [Pseudomonas sp. GW456-E6]PMW33563.1 hypothetical protein C1X48_22020 [Pseudomonas sp. FW305-3-2-15-A-R2A1]PMW36546.1 hypothetical protein C1X45_14890 [Pseudomonas sp. GW460-7]